MNRRILLIDADHDFYARLSDLLGRYRLDILVRPDPDEAIADGAIDLPAAIFLAVDEPDKAGFKTFQTLKKGPLAKVPILLVTRSVASGAMQKHRGLKTHADEYLDKRALSDDELVGKLDNLITLGEVVSAGDSLDIPLEVDDMAVGQDEMVLEETVGDDGDEAFDHGSKTVAGRSEAVDQMVAAETDAAFDALLGFGDEPAAPSVAEQLRAAPDQVSAAAAEQHAEDMSTTIAPPISDSAAPQEIEHQPNSDVFDTFSRESARPAIGRAAIGRAAIDEPAMDAQPALAEVAEAAEAVEAVEPPLEHEAPVVQQAAEVSESAPHRSYESSPAIMLADDDLQLLEEDLVEEESIEDSGGVPEPVPHVNLVAQDDDEPEQAVPLAAVVDAVPQVIEAPVMAAFEPAPEPEPEPVHVRAPSEPGIAMPRASSEPKPMRSFDLGLDAIALDAENEQSGVYDRKSLRKIGELERQLAQLKTELERARAASTEGGGAARGSREREFFNLREQLNAKDAELRRATGERDAKTRELTDLEERLRQVQQTRMDLEAKAAELEQRVATDGAKSSALATREKQLAAQIASTQQDLESRSQALSASETARAQLERDLTTERATRAASASDAERALRVEREQMIARHQGELSQLRVEHAGAQAVALEKLRQELAGSQAAALEAARAENEAALEVVRKQAAAAVETARTEAATEAEQAATRAAADHAAELQRLRDDQAAALAKSAEERDAAIARLTGERDAALVDAGTSQQRLRDEHAAVIAKVGAERDAVVAQVGAEREAALSQLRNEQASELERLAVDHAVELQQARDDLAAERAALSTSRDKAVAEIAGELANARAEAETARAAHAEALAQHAAKHAAELAEQANQHAAAMAEREAELMTQRQDEAIAHTAALAELKVELDRQAAQHGIKLDGAKKELDDVLQLHEQAKSRLLADQENAAAERAAAHAAELAQLAADKQAAIDDIGRAQSEHRKVLADAAAQHAADLANTKELADREISELKGFLIQAKRSIEEATVRHQAERDAIEQAHATALADHKAQHERALAVASGETIRVKAVADAEHQRAMAAKDADLDKERKATASEHAKVVKDLSAERDELQRGLSAARDTIRRSEGELAAAVQTIADRNAELRSHAAAIAERDQRLSDLRKEIDGLETENASYQDQVLRAYQKIKSDEAMVARAKKAMAIALTVLDEDPKPKADA